MNPTTLYEPVLYSYVASWQPAEQILILQKSNSSQQIYAASCRDFNRGDQTPVELFLAGIAVEIPHSDRR
jgi:hypothetical protein